MENKSVLSWSNDEVSYLRNHIGYIPLEKIAITLNRTVTAIERKMERMKISIQSVQMDKNSVSFNQLSQILQIDSKSIKRWISKYRFPAIELKLKATSIQILYYVSVEKFWEWANKHRQVINWHKLERRALLPEPKWLKEVLREVVIEKNKSWTKQEDVLVWSMYYFENLNMKNIAEKQNRTAVSIEKRLKRLREKGFAKEMSCHTPKYTPVAEETELPTSNKLSLKTWTDKEEKRVIQLFYYWRWSQKAIAVELDRTKNAIERKLNSLRKAGRITEKHVQARRQRKGWSDSALQTLQQLRFVEKKKITEIAVAFPNYTVHEVTIKLGELKNLQQVG